MKTRFAYLEQAKVAKVAEREIPDELADNEILVHMLGNNLCTTDYQHWMGLREHQGYPMAGGHEGAATVLKVGAGVRTIAPGDYVAFGYESCGVCENCKKGNDFQCLNKGGRGVKSEDGYLGSFGMAQYRIVKEGAVIKMNPAIPPEQAGFLEPVATVCKGISKLRVKPHETVVVVGAGTMGLANAQVARAFGAHVIVTELMPNKIERAREAGFVVIDSKNEDTVERVRELTDGKMADAVILAVSNKIVVEQSFDLIKQLDGRILMFAAGYPNPECHIDVNMIHYRRIEFIGTFCADSRDMYTSAMLINTGAIDCSFMCEPNQHPLEDIQGAFEEAATPGKYRVHVVIPE